LFVSHFPKYKKMEIIIPNSLVQYKSKVIKF
jgi:hypothetical protein